MSALRASAAIPSFAFVAQEPVPALRFRGGPGCVLAGGCPVGKKIIAGWFQRGRGLALGIMIGALTLRSAVPHAVNSLGGISWRNVVLLGSVQAIIGAFIVLLGVHE